MSDAVIVIGAGHAGAQAVEALRTGGFQGPIALIGDEAFRPYERPPLSKQLLLDEIEVDRVFLKRESFYADKQIDLILKTTVTAIDRANHRVTLADGRALDYGKLIIATGARARKLDVPGAELNGLFYLRTLADTQAIRPKLQPGAHIAIVGGGYIGLEVAASAIKFGCKVTLVEMQDRLLSRVVAPEVAAFYEKEHRAKGVEIRYGVMAESFSGMGGEVRQMHLSDRTTLDIDLAVIGIGSIPNTELASAAGLAVSNGIVVDDCGRTEDPDVFAVGDVTNHLNTLLGCRLRLESVPAAMGQARAAASVICGNPKPFNDVPWFWSDQYDLKLQMVGLSQPDDQLVLRGNPADRKFAAFYLRGGAVVAVNAVNATKDFVGGKKIVAEKKRVDPVRLADTSILLAEV